MDQDVLSLKTVLSLEPVYSELEQLLDIDSFSKLLCTAPRVYRDWILPAPWRGETFQALIREEQQNGQ